MKVLDHLEPFGMMTLIQTGMEMTLPQIGCTGDPGDVDQEEIAMIVIRTTTPQM